MIFSILAVWNNKKKAHKQWTLVYWEMYENKNKYEITLKQFKFTWNNAKTVQLHRKSKYCHLFFARTSFVFFFSGSLLICMALSLFRFGFLGLEFFSCQRLVDYFLFQGIRRPNVQGYCKYSRDLCPLKGPGGRWGLALKGLLLQNSR